MDALAGLPLLGGLIRLIPWLVIGALLVRALSQTRDLAASLGGSVRAKYEELWEAAQASERE